MQFVHTARLIRPVDLSLIGLLRKLRPEDWDRETVAGSWRVRDVAAHLLDTATRKLSLARDGNFVEAVSIHSPQDLVDLINRINQEGVRVYRRLSPRVLIRMMEVICSESADFHEALDPMAPALFAVSWAGEAQSLNWFDTARELTERWHHQQQIRLAVGETEDVDPHIHHAVLDCFLRGLPHHFRSVTAADGVALNVSITGPAGGDWFLVRENDAWTPHAGSSASASGSITIPDSIAWRVFTKGIAFAEAAPQCRIEGDTLLGGHVLRLVSIVG